MKFVVLLLVVFTLGCRSEIMSESFPAQRPQVLTDGKGQKWIVEHHIGSTYSVKPLPKEENEDE